MRHIASSTGFSIFSNPDNMEETVKSVPSPVQNFSWDGSVLSSTKKELRIKDLVKKSIGGYLVDGIIRQSVDKYSEMFKDFDLTGKDAQTKYLKKRLKSISINTSEHWKTLLTRGITEYFKSGNFFLLKIRGGGPHIGKRPLYKNKPYSISHLYIISADRLEPVINTATGLTVGWKLTDQRKNTAIKTVLSDDIKLPADQALYTIARDPQVTEKMLIPGVDIVQIAYKKGADSNWGFGISFNALEDVAAARSVEMATLVMTKKFSNPILHHRILKAPNPMSGIQKEISDAYSLHRRTPVDGVIITSGNHEIKAVGAESQALRNEGYLKFFRALSCASLGTSPYIMGLEPATLGTAQASTEELRNKVRFCQNDIARQIELLLFNELLWEGGFDPYMNDDDEVHLEFDDIDVDRTIKQQTHAADQFTKGMIDHDMALSAGKYKDKPKDHLLYHNKVTIPVEKAKIAAKGEQDVRVAKAKPRPKSTKEFQNLVLPLLPQTEDQIEDLIILLERRFGYNKDILMAVVPQIQLLIGNEEAMIAYLYQVLEDEAHGTN